MNLLELNKLVEKITTIQDHLSRYERDPLLTDSLHHYLEVIHFTYGAYLDDLLFEVYDEYCEDNQIQPIERYLTPEGVAVEADDFPGVRYQLKLKAFPLRFELENQVIGNQEIVWKAA